MARVHNQSFFTFIPHLWSVLGIMQGVSMLTEIGQAVSALSEILSLLKKGALNAQMITTKSNRYKGRES